MMTVPQNPQSPLVISSPSSQPAHSASEHEITLRFVVRLSDAGPDGYIDAGTGLQWIDRAAYACATRWSGTYSVTAYVGNAYFKMPVRSGDLAEVHARLIHTGRSSMHILATIKAASVPNAELRDAAQCVLAFVAVDESGARVPVRQWIPTTPQGEQLERIASDRVGIRRVVEEIMNGLSYSNDGGAQQCTLRLLAAPGDVNWGGNVHGGNIMRWIDEGGQVCTQEWVEGRTFASYIGGIRFYRPIHIGEVVEINARLVHTGERSMHVVVHVYATDPRTAERRLATQALTVFVQRTEHGRAVPVSQWTPTSAEDRTHDEAASKLIRLRSTLESFQITDSHGGVAGHSEPDNSIAQSQLTPERANLALELARRRTSTLATESMVAVVDANAELVCCTRTVGVSSSRLELLLQRVRSVHGGVRSTSGPATISRVGSNFITWRALSSGDHRVGAQPVGALLVLCPDAYSCSDIATFVDDEMSRFDERHRRNLT